MGRPKLSDEERRDEQISIGLTRREFELYHARARRSGMRPVDFGRAQIFGDHRAPSGQGGSLPHLDPLLFVGLSRLGNNLNQIARRLNMLGYPVPATLEPLLQDIRALLNKGLERGS